MSDCSLLCYKMNMKIDLIEFDKNKNQLLWLIFKNCIYDLIFIPLFTFKKHSEFCKGMYTNI